MNDRITVHLIDNLNRLKDTILHFSKSDNIAFLQNNAAPILEPFLEWLIATHSEVPDLGRYGFKCSYFILKKGTLRFL